MVSKVGMAFIGFLLTTIVGMLAWFLPSLSGRIDEYQRMENTKLEQIYDIKSSVFELNHTVDDIQAEVSNGKKNNELIMKSVNGKLDILIHDTRNLCSQIKRYGDTQNWVNHPECLLDK